MKESGLFCAVCNTQEAVRMYRLKNGLRMPLCLKDLPGMVEYIDWDATEKEDKAHEGSKKTNKRGAGEISKNYRRPVDE